MTVIAAGTPAPQFELTRKDGTKFTEKDLDGQGTVLAPDAVVRWSFQAATPAELPSAELLRAGVDAAFANA